MDNRIVQLQPWRDLLLGLTAQGEIYEVVIERGEPVQLRLIHPNSFPVR